jgi:hypothetical protein
MSGEAKPWRVAWLLARTPDGKRAPRPQHKDYVDHAGAVAHKQRLHRQYGDAVTTCVTPTPAPRVKIKAASPPQPVVTEETNPVFWVSAFVPRRNGSRAIVQHHGFADRDRAEACKAALKSREGGAAVCLTTERPAGARLPKGRGDARG